MLRPSRVVPRFSSSQLALGLAVVALGAGWAIARAPLTYALAICVGVPLLALSAWEPVVGLGLAIILGPAKALLAVAYPSIPEPGQVFFFLALAGWLARGLVQRRLVVPLNQLLVPLGLYLAAGLFSLLQAVSLQEGLKEFVKWAEIVVALVVVISEAQRGRVRWVIAAILAAGAAQAAVGIWEFQFRGTGPKTFLLPSGQYRAYGTFEQPNPYAGFLGLIWPLAGGLAWAMAARVWPKVRARAKGWGWEFAGLAGLAAITLTLVVGLYVSSSRGAWLGAAAAVLAMALFLSRRLRIGLPLVVLALAAGWGLWQAGLLPASLTSRLVSVADFVNVTDVRGVNINDTNFALVERLAHWQAAVSMAEEHPWLGVGLGNYATAYPTVRLLNWPNALGHAHNIYLNALAETGLIGLAAYVLLWAWVIALTIRVLVRATGLERGLALGLLGAWTHLSAHQIVDNLYVNNIHFLIAGLLALLVYLSQGKPRDKARGLI
jgi:putative inorganic carbon (HCO3(-)) transporter